MLHTGAGVVLATPGVVMVAPQTLVRNAEGRKVKAARTDIGKARPRGIIEARVLRGSGPS